MAHPGDAQAFRARLEQVIAQSGLRPAAFARRIGIDRSTLSQLLSPANDRLPRAETLAAIARGSRVSIDWLLGLSQRREIGAELVEAPLTIVPQAQAPLNERFVGWYEAAAGGKMRTVPLTFPDFLKRPEVLRFEYAGTIEAESESLLGEKRGRIERAIRDGGEVEACFSVQAIEAFARGEAQWRGLDAAIRAAQLTSLAALADELYPTLRLFLYDLSDTYSAPFTVFGQERAVIYLGPSYLVLNASEHIRMLTRRFDELIRLARIQPHEIAAFLTGLQPGLGPSRR